MWGRASFWRVRACFKAVWVANCSKDGVPTRRTAASSPVIASKALSPRYSWRGMDLIIIKLPHKNCFIISRILLQHKGNYNIKECIAVIGKDSFDLTLWYYLQHILSEPEEIMTLNGQKLPMRLQVAYISFSAHTDYRQTAEFIRELKPPHVVRRLFLLLSWSVHLVRFCEETLSH